ncbi:TPA: hypothetical protein DCE37_14305 [Candidatus Latescibacteria bacterium]|nr:hypothetical protein [Candidatus Latescibacterota bacterium]
MEIDLAKAESYNNPDPSPAAKRETVTVRSIILGLLTIFVSTVYMDHYAGNLVKTYFPVAVLIPFVAWILLNTGIRLTVPRLALSRTELIVILGMMWIAGSLPTVGWGLYAVSMVPSPEFFAAPENRMADVVLPLLPKWLFLGNEDPRVTSAYTGLAADESIPWAIWVRPLFWWVVPGVAGVAATLFGSVLFLRQWDETERLAFPMAQFPMDMLDTSPDGIPSVFKERLFWIGFAITGGIILWNIVGYFAISLPRITLFDASNTKVLEVGRYFPPFYMKIQPLLMGLAYLAPTDLLFSIWFYNVINTFKVGMLNRTGFTVGIEGQPAEAGTIAALESHGALCMLVVWSIWVSRAHLTATVQQALGPRDQDDGAPVSFRTAWIGWLFSIGILGGWLYSAGMSLWATALTLTFLFACYFGISKYAAATGFTFIRPSGSKGYGIFRQLFGTTSISPSSHVVSVLLQDNVFFGNTLRTAFPVAVPHIFKMLGDQLRRHKVIIFALLFAYVFGLATSSGSRIFRAYTEGGLNGILVTNDMQRLASAIPFIEGTKIWFFDYQKTGVWLFGAAEAAILTILRTRVAWWPLHPVAVAFPERRYVIALFVVWAAKTLTMKIGGVRGYRRSIPFWYGTVCGYLFGIALSSLVDAIWFPDEGHFVHGF